MALHCVASCTVEPVLLDLPSLNTFSHLGLSDEKKLINSLQKCTMPTFSLASGLITDMMTVTTIFFPALVGHRFYQAS